MRSPYALGLIVGWMLGACGGAQNETASSDTAAASDPLSSADWRLVNNRNVQAGLVFSGANGTLTLVNHTGASLTTPTLFLYNTTTGEASTIAVAGETTIADDATYTGTLTYPNDAAPDAAAYFGLALDAIPAGKFVTASTFDALPLSITAGPVTDTATNLVLNPSASTLPLMTTGIWDFAMTGGAENLTGTHCPSGSGGLITAGSAEWYPDCSGYSANMTIDSAYLEFDLYPAPTNAFVSPSYSFPVVSDDSTVSGTTTFTITPQSPSAATGTLHWDNSLGCTADYPMTMTLNTATSVSTIDLCEGTWSLTYGSGGAVVCGSSVFNLNALAFAPSTVGTLSTVDTPSGVPLAMNFDTTSGSFFMLRQGCTNNYGSMLVPSAFGVTIDSSGNPVVLNMSFQGVALAPGSVVGFGLLNGIGSTTNCTASFTFTMAASPGC